ncbi:MAG: hypothetical protein M1812_002094 [Candelaria pacifica]|nr:MAG: hypothetical protein M1812_002094 [Candelaria pacifica]
MSELRALFVGNIHVTRRALVETIKDAGFIISDWSSRGGENYLRIVFPNRREAEAAMRLLKHIQLPNGNIPFVKWHNSQATSLPVIPWVSRVMPTMMDLEVACLTRLLTFADSSHGVAVAPSLPAVSAASAPAVSAASASAVFAASAPAVSALSAVSGVLLGGPSAVSPPAASGISRPGVSGVSWPGVSAASLPAASGDSPPGVSGSAVPAGFSVYRPAVSPASPAAFGVSWSAVPAAFGVSRPAVPAAFGVSRPAVSRSGVSAASPAASDVSRSGVSRSGVSRSGVSRSGVSRSGVSRSGVSRSGVSPPAVSAASPTVSVRSRARSPSSRDTVSSTHNTLSVIRLGASSVASVVSRDSLARSTRSNAAQAFSDATRSQLRMLSQRPPSTTGSISASAQFEPPDAPSSPQYHVIGRIIRKRRMASGGLEYNVNWEGYPGKHYWEKEESLERDVPEMVAAYNEEHPETPSSHDTATIMEYEEPSQSSYHTATQAFNNDDDDNDDDNDNDNDDDDDEDEDEEGESAGAPGRSSKRRKIGRPECATMLKTRRSPAETTHFRGVAAAAYERTMNPDRNCITPDEPRPNFDCQIYNSGFNTRMRSGVLSYTFANGDHIRETLPAVILRWIADGVDVCRWKGIEGDFSISHLCGNGGCGVAGHCRLESDSLNMIRKSCHRDGECDRSHRPRCITGVQLSKGDLGRKWYHSQN